MRRPISSFFTLSPGFNTVVVYGSLRTAHAELAAFGRARRFEGVGEVELRLG